MSRKPMDFALDVPSEAAAPPPKQVKPKGAPQAPTDGSKKTVGARVTTSIYRQLKSHAALSGETVQDLVEQAIREKLERLAKRTQNTAAS